MGRHIPFSLTSNIDFFLDKEFRCPNSDVIGIPPPEPLGIVIDPIETVVLSSTINSSLLFKTLAMPSMTVSAFRLSHFCKGITTGFFRPLFCITILPKSDPFALTSSRTLSNIPYKRSYMSLSFLPRKLSSRRTSYSVSFALFLANTFSPFFRKEYVDLSPIPNPT